MKSLVENFVNVWDGDVQTMKSLLEKSDMVNSGFSPDVPTYVFGDGSYIMFHNNKEYTTAYRTKRQVEYGSSQTIVR